MLALTFVSQGPYQRRARRSPGQLHHSRPRMGNPNQPLPQRHRHRHDPGRRQPPRDRGPGGLRRHQQEHQRGRPCPVLRPLHRLLQLERRLSRRVRSYRLLLQPVSRLGVGHPHQVRCRVLAQGQGHSRPGPRPSTSQHFPQPIPDEFLFANPVSGQLWSRELLLSRSHLLVQRCETPTNTNPPFACLSL